MNFRQLKKLVKEAVTDWVDDYAPSMGAALAYYSLFSIAPLLVIAIAVAGFFFGEEAARGEILGQLRGLIGEEGAAAVQGLLKSASEPRHGVIATAVGLVTLLIGATTVFGELQSDLDRIWRVPPPKQGGGIWVLLRSRVLSFGMVIGIGFLLLVSLIVSAILAALSKWWLPLFGGWMILFAVTNAVVSFAIITVAFAMIFKFLPRVSIDWRDVWIGAAVTSLLFTAGKFLIGLYLGRSSVASGFGAAGSVVVLMVWIYFSAQIFLLGAEFTSVYAHRYGSRRAESKLNPPLGSPSRARAVSQPEAESLRVT